MGFLEIHPPLPITDTTEADRMAFETALANAEQAMEKRRRATVTNVTEGSFQTFERVAEAIKLAKQRRDHLLPDP